jgi:hypothetical protein
LSRARRFSHQAFRSVLMDLDEGYALAFSAVARLPRGGDTEVLALFTVEDPEGRSRPPLAIGPRDVPWAVGQCSVNRPRNRGILPIDSYRAILRLNDPRVWQTAETVAVSLHDPAPLGERLKLDASMGRLETLRAILGGLESNAITVELRAGDGGFLLRVAGPKVKGSRDYDVRTPFREILRDFLFPDPIDDFEPLTLPS